MPRLHRPSPVSGGAMTPAQWLAVISLAAALVVVYVVLTEAGK